MVPRNLKAIVFDVDGTLYDAKPLRRAMTGKLILHCLGSPVSGFQTLKGLRHYRAAHEELRDEMCEDLSERQIQLASARSSLPARQIAEAVRFWMHEQPLPLLKQYIRPGLRPVLEAAKSKKLLLAVLSDYPAEWKLRAMGIRGFFDLVMSAQDSEIQRLKPHPRGLHIVLQKLGVSENEALYVGDRGEVDGACARTAGVNSWIVSRRPAQSFYGLLEAIHRLQWTPEMAAQGVQNIVPRT